MKARNGHSELLSLCVIAFMTCPAVAQTDPVTFDQTVINRINLIFDQLERDSDFNAAEQDTVKLFDQVIAYAPDNDPVPFRDVAYALRLIRQLKRVDSDTNMDLLKYLRANSGLAYRLAFVIQPDEDPAAVYGVLNRLQHQFGKRVNAYTDLAVAISVVHDQPLVHSINENKVEAASAEEIFAFYVKHETQMLFGIKKVPAELLIYVVDNAVSIPEMQWAVDRYAGHRKVGALFFDIDYDYAHYRNGTVKKVTAAGWSLPNILRHGGVCADQAYFAVAVGKSIGVPTAYTWGLGGNVAHAWVGFLEARGKYGFWNFDIGRYQAYRGVKGHVTDPQTGKLVPDSYVALLGKLIGSKAVERQSAAAMTDAALRLFQFEQDEVAFEPPPLTESNATPIRATGVAGVTDLLETGLKKCAGYAPAWFVLHDLATQDKLSPDEVKIWAGRIEKMCGQNYPDFSLALLTPMITSVKDTKDQNALWEKAFKIYSRRTDLAAEIRVAQGELWLNAGNVKRAGVCYEDVINRFANSGPFVIEALGRIEQLFLEAGKQDRVPQVYAHTWSRITKPKRTATRFSVQSNWYCVGSLYAEKLEAAGMLSDAQHVRRQLQTATGAPARSP